MANVASRLTVKPLHPLFVAEITGIDLTQPVSREDVQVIWDNRCTLHRATTFDKTKYRRKMHRTTVAGSMPEAVLARLPEPAVA